MLSDYNSLNAYHLLKTPMRVVDHSMAHWPWDADESAAGSGRWVTDSGTRWWSAVGCRWAAGHNKGAIPSWVGCAVCRFAQVFYPDNCLWSNRHCCGSIAHTFYGAIPADMAPLRRSSADPSGVGGVWTTVCIPDSDVCEWDSCSSSSLLLEDLRKRSYSQLPLPDSLKAAKYISDEVDEKKLEELDGVFIFFRKSYKKLKEGN